MKEKEAFELREKYLEGSSSLSEEQYLLETSGNSLSPDDTWFSFLKEYKNRVPVALEDNIRNLILKRSSKRRLFIRLSSAAAILIGVFSLIVLIPGRQTAMDQERKMAQLEEAYKMINSKNVLVAENDIIYEDETLIIYLKY